MERNLLSYFQRYNLAFDLIKNSQINMKLIEKK